MLMVSRSGPSSGFTSDRLCDLGHGELSEILDSFSVQLGFRFVLLQHRDALGPKSAQERRCKRRPEEGVKFPGAGVLSNWEPSDVDAWNRTQVSLKNSMCF